MAAKSDITNNWNNFEDVEAIERDRPWEGEIPPGSEIYQNINGFLIPPGVDIEEIRAAREAAQAAEDAATVEISTPEAKEEIVPEAKEAATPAAEPAPVSAPKRSTPQIMKPHQVRGPDGTVAGKAKEATKPKEDAVSRRYDLDDYDSFGTAKVGCPNQDFIKPGFRLGSVGSRIAMGGVGKTWFSLQEAVAIATGGIFCGHQYKRGGVIYLSADDLKDEIRERCKTLSEAPDFTPEMDKMADANLKILYLFGTGADVLEFVDETLLFEEAMTRFVNKVQPTFYGEDKLRLIIFDTLCRFSKVDENSTNDMAEVLTKIERIAKKFRCSCLFLHHMNKSSAVKGEAAIQQSSRGASVLVDNIRYQEYLQVMSKEMAKKYGEADHSGRVSNAIDEEHQRYIEWGVAKQNCGQNVKSVWLKRRLNGIMDPCKIGKFDGNTALPQSYQHSKGNKGEFGAS